MESTLGLGDSVGGAGGLISSKAEAGVLKSKLVVLPSWELEMVETGAGVEAI
ncbi:Hypothetical predicted protein, partial [Olea europaea subsp. europaea]